MRVVGYHIKQEDGTYKFVLEKRYVILDEHNNIVQIDDKVFGSITIQYPKSWPKQYSVITFK